MRSSPRIQHKDLQARMPRGPRPSAHARFRAKAGYISWEGYLNKRPETIAMKEYLDTIIPKELRAVNTTEGFDDLTEDEIASMKASNHMSIPQRNRKGIPNKKPQAVHGTVSSSTSTGTQPRGQPLRAQPSLPLAGSINSPITIGSSSTGTDDDQDGSGDFRDKAPRTSQGGEIIQLALIPVRLQFTQLTGELSHPTNLVLSFSDQVDALQCRLGHTWGLQGYRAVPTRLDRGTRWEVFPLGLLASPRNLPSMCKIPPNLPQFCRHASYAIIIFNEDLAWYGSRGAFWNGI